MKHIKKPDEVKEYLPIYANTTNEHFTQMAISLLSSFIVK